jgi:hypothetical protein
MGWLLDQVILTLNILAFGLLVAMVFGAFGMGLRSYSVWDARAPWLPRVMGTVFAAMAALPLLAIYWAGYRWAGFPGWMRWIVG